MSDDLVARLRHAWDERERQYAEDERMAKRAAWGHLAWTYDRETFTVSSNAYPVAGRKRDGEPLNDVDGEHIARHDPARVLAEVQRGRRDLATKRRILDQLSDAQSRRLYYDRDGEEPFVSEARATVEALQNVVRVLAAAEGLA